MNEELNRERAGGLRLSLLLVISLIVTGLIALWFFVYYLRGYQIDRSMKQLTITEDFTESSLGVVSVGVKFDGELYTIQSLTQIDTLPTVVDIVVTYEDDTVVNKQAYISYSDDITDIEYIDNVYGRIILPN